MDLASSVLQTLREATDEEYLDALARDAARIIAKTAEETLFDDATPEASTGNIVTIIVNPKQTDNHDDVMPDESHIQESRCVHSPSESATTNFGKIRIAPKHPSLLCDFFGLPRLSKSAGLQHRNSLDMDSGVGASNIQEHVVHVNDDQETDKGIIGLRKFAPLMKIASNMKNKSPTIKSNVDNDYSIKKFPDFKSTIVQNKLKDLISNKSSLGIKKVSSLPLIPKMRLGNSLSKVSGKNNGDLSLSPSNVQEKTTEKPAFFRTKSHLENVFEKSRPVSLKNLLKLKDVELIPLKDIVNKATERAKFKPKFAPPAIFRKGEDVVLSHKHDKAREAENKEMLETFPRNNNVDFFDIEVSPSQVVEQITENNCQNQATKKSTTSTKESETNIEYYKDNTSSIETFDTLPSPTHIQSVVNDKNTDLDNSQSDELTDNIDDCNTHSFSVTETNLLQVTERSWDDEIEDTNNSELASRIINGLTTETVTEQQSRESNDVLNENDCVNNNNDDADSMIDSSNNVNHVIAQTDFVQENDVDSVTDKNIMMEESCSHEQQAGNNVNTLDSNSDSNLVNPLSLDQTFSKIKENIIKKYENLKNPKTKSKDSNIIDPKLPSNNIENKELFAIKDENQDSDCQNEESFEITTVKPDICNEELENVNESTGNISMEDLQKISDSMLQEEKEREARIAECNKPLEEVTEPNDPLETHGIETEILDSEKSAASLNEVIVDPQNPDDFSDKNEDDVKKKCRSELVLPKKSLAQLTDTNTEASEVFINRIPQSKNIMDKPCLLDEIEQPNENNLNLLRGQLPDIQDIFKLPPLPTLDEFTFKLTSLFDKDERDVEEFSSSEADSMTDTSNILNPTMKTEARTTNFLSSRPSLRLEDVNLDILQLKPISKIPKIDLHSFKVKLPLPKDLRLKPIKLQSAIEDHGSLLGTTLSIGRPSDKNRKINLDNFRRQMNTHDQNFLGIPLKDRNILGLSDLSENIHSHAKNNWRSMHRTLESNLKKAIKIPTKLKSYDLLEVISRNHEDVNDKLKALHIDFNDRIESMRNDLIDKSRFVTGEFPNRKLNTKSFSSFSNKKKGKPLSLISSQPKLVTGTRESKKTLTSRRLDHGRQIGVGALQPVANPKKFKMPAAASVPVPRTIEVPELKTTSLKLPGLAIQRDSGLKAVQTKESSAGFLKQASKTSHTINTPLGKSINPFKDSKIKVTFSTTPRPTVTPKLQSRIFTTPSSVYKTNTGRSQGRFGAKATYGDHNGSPSEVRQSMISPPMSSHLNQHNFVNPTTVSDSTEIKRSYDDQMALLKTSSQSNIGKLVWEENSEADTEPRKGTELQSWPKISESAFLSKVREAVKARLSKVNSPITLKLSDVQSNLENGPLVENEVHNSNTDMTRSASENIDVKEVQPLKENVSYKCRMVCTKEK